MASLKGATGATGSGASFLFTAERITSTSAPAQAANWLLPWGLTIYPQTTSTQNWSPSPVAGSIKKIRMSRVATAGDLTFEIQVNGVTRVTTAALAGGAGAASATDSGTYAVAVGDKLTVKMTAATPDSTTFTFPQLTFTVE